MPDDQIDNSNTPETSSATSISGGVNVDAGRDVNIGGDVVGRDKITQNIHITQVGSRLTREGKAIPEHANVMISTTICDLPEHRKEVLDACLRQSMFPAMMEYLPASDDDAVTASLKLVDQADIYMGVFAHRYGYSPRGHDISITEMEYNRAVERRIPRLIFMMDKDHSVTIDQVESGDGATKLGAFKQRMQAENIVNFFKSPTDLRAHVINSLSQYRVSNLSAFHYISDIPSPPEAYIAHPYTLLQTHRLIGRQAELNLLTDWAANPDSDMYQARILSIVGIGGMGKSALMWKWFNDIAPQEMNPLAGRIWWSFYESDATFENFVIRALAYTSRRSLEAVQEIPLSDREFLLLAQLSREPFLIVLDGLERVLVAYARMDAARLQDNQIEDKKSLRKTIDPRIGRFLRELIQIQNSRILVSSRLYPAELEIDTGDIMRGSARYNMIGLADADAVELWRAFGVSGSRDELLPIFATIDKHPLLIQSLAGEIKRYRRVPGDFAEWRKANLRFDPTRYAQVQEAMGHVLEFALRSLDHETRKLLETITAFRMPASYDTLAALFAGEGKLFATEMRLDSVLQELEDRGLVGWDRRANRYDLHPIVRSVVWSELGSDTRNGVLTSLHAHFDSLPSIAEDDISSFEDLAPVIELYSILIGLGRYKDAYDLFRERLDQTTLYRLSASQQRANLLAMLFPDGVERLPKLGVARDQAYVFNALAQAYLFYGEPEIATRFYLRDYDICRSVSDRYNAAVALCNLSDALRLTGCLYESEADARLALTIFREQGHFSSEIVSLYLTGLVLTIRGMVADSATVMQRALRQSTSARDYRVFGILCAAQRALWVGVPASALALANEAWELSCVERIESYLIRAARLQGAAKLSLNNFADANNRLHHALTRARAVSNVGEEIQTLTALAELLRGQNDLKAARELLGDVWELAERGPYPLFYADAFNVLAHIERDEGNHAAAVEAATKAYRFAWCDGEPYAYYWGLAAARKHLLELGAPEPDMPPFDESKFEPMPAVEINPRDEFYVEEGEA
jgi:tetratricopeptide (TPR) repeat protein